jgi:eukaryotic-like serine/threonine-protein kinase
MKESLPIPGTTISHYRILSRLGAGGMGEVYKAQDTTELDRIVAIKVLPSDLAGDKERMQRFIQEAKTASSLNHANILTIFEIGEADGMRFIVTEFIEGETLRQRMARARLELNEALDIAIQVAAALTAAHKSSIVHRDIKPENLMLREDGIVKVLDFGLAKSTMNPATHTDSEGATRLLVNTSPGLVMGTVSYMSPEQARGLQVDERTDIWSLGVVVYEMIAARLPFAGETTSDVISLILQREPPALTRLLPAAAERIDEIVTKALMKDREERYQSAKDLLIDLKRLKQKLDVKAEIERTQAPEQGTATGEAKPNGAQEAVPISHASSARALTVEGAHTTSSAEYIVAEIRSHKLAALIALLVLVIGAIGLSFYLHARNPEVAIDSIAVLPFENRSADPDTEYLSDGLTESLIYRLSQLHNLTVSPRSVVYRYKGKEIDSLKAGSELGVRAVLSGRIVQRGDQLTISAELTDVRHHKQLWGEQYERKMSDLLATQREIAREITENLKVRVSGEEQQLASKHYTESNEAYQSYLKGRFYWNKRTAEALKKAIEYFNQAIEKDPRFALAYAGLADCYSVPANPLSPREKMPKAKAAAMRALELDETLAEAHTSLAGILAAYDWDWTGAEKEFKRAIELNPRYALAHQWYARYLDATGRHDEGIAEARRAQELDPLSLIMNFEVGQAFYFARKYDQAIEQFKKTLELDPNFPPVYSFFPAAYEQKGMYDEAIAGFQKAITLKAGTEGSLFGLGHVYAVSGKQGEARKVLNELKQRSGQVYVPGNGMALVYAGLGEKDQAFTWLEKAYEERSFQMQYLKVEPRWDSLRSDARFADLLRRIGL